MIRARNVLNATERLVRQLLQHRLIVSYRAHNGDGLGTIISSNSVFSHVPLLLRLVTANSLLENYSADLTEQAMGHAPS